MRAIPACRRTLAAAALLALALAPAAAAPAPTGPAPDKDDAGNPVEKLRKQLDRTITIKIDKQPLSTAIDALREKAKINIGVDNLTIQQQCGFTPDMPPTPVEVDLKDVTVRAALRAILSPYGLSYAPIGDSVIVTTDDMAMARQLRQRVNVDVQKADFAAALRKISRDTAVNLILDTRAEKTAEAKVSLQMDDVPLETAVRLMAEMAGLKPVRVGNVLFVTTKENANELRNDPDIAQPNAAARQAELQLQQLQLQLGAQAAQGVVPGGATIGIAVPPGVAPAVPPQVAPPVEKDKSAPETPADAPKDAPSAK